MINELEFLLKERINHAMVRSHILGHCFILRSLNVFLVWKQLHKKT